MTQNDTPSAHAAPVQFAIARATGPRTQNGKATVAQNALTHGIYSSRPVIPGVESQDEWDSFRAGIVDSLAPADAAQLSLAERAAELSWRLRRVARFEAVVAADHFDRAERDAVPDEPNGIDSLRSRVEICQETLARLRRLPSLPDDAPLPTDDATDLISLAAQEIADVEDETALTVPGVSPSVRIYDSSRWTARLVRDMFTYLASLSRDQEQSWPDGKALLAYLTAEAEDDLRRAEARVASAEREADRLRRRRAFPTSKSLDRAMRVEAHLSRLLASTLHELEALQNRRAGLPSPLVRMDLTAENPEMTKQTP